MTILNNQKKNRVKITELIGDRKDLDKKLKNVEPYVPKSVEDLKKGQKNNFKLENKREVINKLRNTERNEKWLKNDSKEPTIETGDLMKRLQKGIQKVEWDVLIKNRKMASSIDESFYDGIRIDVSGEMIPDPIESFDKSNLHPLVKEALKDHQYIRPLPIQKYSIPIIENKRDLAACSQTGSGKTAAFILPIISGLIKDLEAKKRYNKIRGYLNKESIIVPKALILAPTRELAIQIYDVAKTLIYNHEIKALVIYGGVSKYTQTEKPYKSDIKILIATPGRLIDLVNNNLVLLNEIQYLVLDEADKMLEPGFEEYVEIILSRGIPKNRTTLMYSATFPPDVIKLAERLLNNPINVTIGQSGVIGKNIKQNVLFLSENDKFTFLRKIIDEHIESKDPGKILVFVGLKVLTAKIAQALRNEGYDVEEIHGDLTQEERIIKLKKFSHGSCNAMISTSVAARGLDLPCISHVIIYDFPNNIEEYVHKIGRTGRAGNKGISTLFFTEREIQYANMIVEALEKGGQEIPKWLRNFAEKNKPRESLNLLKKNSKKNSKFNHNKRQKFSAKPQFNQSKILEVQNNHNSDGFFNNPPTESLKKFLNFKEKDTEIRPIIGNETQIKGKVDDNTSAPQKKKYSNVDYVQKWF